MHNVYHVYHVCLFRFHSLLTASPVVYHQDRASQLCCLLWGMLFQGSPSLVQLGLRASQWCILPTT